MTYRDPTSARNHLRHGATALFALVLAACASDQDGLGTTDVGGLFVEVVDASGPVEGVSVTTMPSTERFVTDALGSVLFSKIPSGFYTVTVEHPTLGAARKPVEIATEQLTQAKFLLGDTPPPPPPPPAGAPNVVINTPATGSSFAPGDAINFSATVSDDEDRPDVLRLEWRSDVDGVLDTGRALFDGTAVFTTASLREASHLITLSVTDSGGRTNMASVNIVVEAMTTDVIPVTLNPLTADSNGIDLAWSATTEARPYAYRIHRAEAAGASFEVIDVINDAAMRSYRDTNVTLGRTYLYRVGVKLNGSADEALSNVEMITVGNAINVASQVEVMRVDSTRPVLYALDRVNNSLHFINLTTNTLEKTIFVGSTPADFDINLAGTEMFIANFGSTEIAVVDLATQEKTRSLFVDTEQGNWDGNPYRLACMANDTLVYTSEDQWNNIKLVSAADGSHIAHAGSVYQPDVVASADGTRVYVAESGSSGSTLQRFDLSSTNELTPVDESSRASGYGSRLGVASADGMYLFYGRTKFLAQNLSSTLGTFSETIHASNSDGSVVFGEENIFDGTTFSIIRPLPFATTTMALSPDDATLYLYDDTTSRIFIYDVSDL